MTLTHAVTSGLHAALLFARGQREGVRHVEADMAGARRSFIALPIGMPAIICLRLMGWLQYGVPKHAGHALGLDVAGYVVGWLGFAVISYHVVPLLAPAARWPRFIAAWNWCNVIENLLLVPAGLPGLLHAPAMIDQAAQIFAIGWALWIEWFATRETLGCNGMSAVMLVVLDQMIGLLLAGLGGT